MSLNAVLKNQNIHPSKPFSLFIFNNSEFPKRKE